MGIGRPPPPCWPPICCCICWVCSRASRSIFSYSSALIGSPSPGSVGSLACEFSPTPASRIFSASRCRSSGVSRDQASRMASTISWVSWLPSLCPRSSRSSSRRRPSPASSGIASASWRARSASCERRSSRLSRRSSDSASPSSPSSRAASAASRSASRARSRSAASRRAAAWATARSRDSRSRSAKARAISGSLSSASTAASRARRSSGVDGRRASSSICRCSESSASSASRSSIPSASWWRSSSASRAMASRRSRSSSVRAISGSRSSRVSGSASSTWIIRGPGGVGARGGTGTIRIAASVPAATGSPIRSPLLSEGRTSLGRARPRCSAAATRVRSAAAWSSQLVRIASSAPSRRST